MQSILGVEDLSKYPFLQESIAYTLKRNPKLSLDKLSSVDIMGFDPNLVLSTVKLRLKIGIRTGISPPLSDVHYDVSLASFIISLIIIRASEDKTLYSRFALAEARRSENFLSEELESNPKGKEIAKILFESVAGIKLEEIEGGFLMPLSDYLKYHVKGEESWKLVNRWLYFGQVYVKPHEITHMFRELAMSIIVNRLSSMPKPALQGPILEILKEIEMVRPKPKAIKYSGKFPPCVEYQVNQLKAGVNIPHSARFLIAAYLLNIGWDEDSIVDLFRSAPDFNEKITRYQIEQISGKKGSGTKYMVPSCDKLLALQLCRRDESCDNIKNPLQYGRSFRKQP